MNDWMRRLNGVNNAAIRSVDATTARVGLLAGEQDEDPLHQDDSAEVERHQRCGERSVDEGAVDDEVYLVEAVLEDGYAYGGRNAQKDRRETEAEEEECNIRVFSE